MEFLDLQPATRAQGVVQLPGSKSISNRTLLLAALAQGTTEIRDLLKSDDTDRMLEALRSLGVGVTQIGENDYRVEGIGGFPNKEADLFLGNAGTAFRPLTAALALSGGTYKLHGVPRMHERPIGDLVDALRQIGADITYLGQEGFPPLLIKPAEITAQGTIKIRGDVSSQFLTALLMAQFGVVVERDGWERFTVPAAKGYTSPGTMFVEGDASSASYFLAAGALGRGPVRVQGVGQNSIQGDVAFADALEAIGVKITKGENWIEASAPALPLKAFDRDFNHIPDAAMTLAVVALFCDGPSRLTNIASWRVKETDRIAAMATELRKLGAIVEEGEDWLRVTPVEKLIPNAAIDTYDDHRMAMCFSLASFGGVSVRINDPKCTAKTFPTYFDVFADVVSEK